MTLKIGQTVYTSQKGKGTILSIEGMKANVDFNGIKKVMLTMLLKPNPIFSKTKSYMKEEEIEVKETFNSIVTNLEGTRKERNSMFGFADIYTKLEKLAFTQNHFAGSIIEDARNGKNITKKQAQVVAYFAQKNNLI